MFSKSKYKFYKKVKITKTDIIYKNKINITYHNKVISLYGKPVAAVTSKRGRSPHSGLLKMEDLP